MLKGKNKNNLLDIQRSPRAEDKSSIVCLMNRAKELRTEISTLKMCCLKELFLSAVSTLSRIWVAYYYRFTFLPFRTHITLFPISGPLLIQLLVCYYCPPYALFSFCGKKHYSISFKFISAELKQTCIPLPTSPFT